MSTFEAPVVEFEIEKHPNADTLSIAYIKGWQCIVRTEDFKGETLGVYIPLDAVAAPDHPLLSFMDGKKVKTIKLRKIISQGILLPGSQVEKYLKTKKINKLLLEGVDFHEELELKKWEPNTKPNRLNAGGGQDPYLEAPGWMTKYTDIENWNNHPNLIKEGERVVISEKLHGTSARFYLIKNRLYIGTRNKVLKTEPYVSTREQRRWNSRGLLRRILDLLLFKEPALTAPKDTAWHQIAKKYKIKAHLQYLSMLYTDEDEENGRFLGDVAIYGEIVGPGIQDLEYGLDDVELFIYDIRVSGMNRDKYVDPLTFRKMAKSVGLRTVPILKTGPFELSDLELRNGKDTLNSKHVREGIVIETVEPRFDKFAGRVILKRISEGYLLRKNGTDY